MNRSALVIGSWLVLLAACKTAAVPPAHEERTTAEVPQDLFARVNGVTLHYLDWGGTGDLLLFIPGLSHTAHTFDGIAPAFTDRYRVMGLTRRGHGSSEKPDSIRDMATLVQDIVAFVDAVGGKRTILVGHSYGGLELPLVAARLADRAAGLIFLDAVYDWASLVTARESANIGRYFEPPDSIFRSRAGLEAWYRRRDPRTAGPAQLANLRSQTVLGPDGRIGWQLSNELQAQFLKLAGKGADFSGVKVPTLVLWANQTEPLTGSMKSFGYPAADVEIMRNWAEEVDNKHKRDGIAALRRYVPDATVIEMNGPHTLHWSDPTTVVDHMNRFLNRLGKATN
jgi:pimeloyl-ACP methyl ester carboxylesterase